MNHDASAYYLLHVKRFIIGLYAFILPFTDWIPVKLNGILIMLLALIWLYETVVSKSEKRSWSSWHMLVLSGIFLVQLLSLFHGGVLNDILSGIIIKLPFLIFPILFWRHSFVEKDLAVIKILFIAGCFFALLLSLRFLFYVPVSNWGMLNYHNYEEYLVLHRPYFGIYLLTAVIFLTDLKGFRISKLIIVLFFLWFLWFIQVKMSFFILFVLIFIRMIFYAGLRARRILFITGFMLTFLVVSMGLQYYLKHRNNIDQLSQKERFWVLSLNTRLIHWDCGWRIFKDHVGVGIGSGNVSAQMNECYQTNHAGVFQFVKNFNIHNEFLEEAVRHGMVGAIIYFLCFFFFIKVAGSVRNMPYFSFLIIVILASITETILSREQGVLMIAFFNTIFYLSHMLRHQETDSALQINDPSLSASFGSK